MFGRSNSTPSRKPVDVGESVAVLDEAPHMLPLFSPGVSPKRKSVEAVLLERGQVTT